MLTGVRFNSWGHGFNSPGMLFFGSFEANNQQHMWTLQTLPLFILIGALGMHLSLIPSSRDGRIIRDVFRVILFFARWTLRIIV